MNCFGHVDYSSSDCYLSHLEMEDIHSWSKYFNRTEHLNADEQRRINRIFNQLVFTILQYEREQDFQLLEALAKRCLLDEDQSIIFRIVDQQRLIKVRQLCQRSKHFPSIDKFLSNRVFQDKSNDLILPPIMKSSSDQRRSPSISTDDNFIRLPKKKKQGTSKICSPATMKSLSQSLTMSSPVTLQNLYEAIPAATLHFAEDEYVWHANRPVNMIMATGVQLPDVLIEPVGNVNQSNDEFFSKIIEDLILEDQRRHPTDSSLALKQWKEKHNDDPYGQSLIPRRMNGFETILYLVQHRHLGEIQRFFLNVVSTNRHYNPYDLLTVPQYEIDRENHYVFSVFGVLNVRSNGADVEFFHLSEWYRHAKFWNSIRQIRFFRHFLLQKQFQRWLANARFHRFLRHRSEILRKHLFYQDNSIFQMAILQIQRVIEEFQRLNFFPKLFRGMNLSLNDLQTMIQRHSEDILQYTKKFFSHINTIIEKTKEATSEKFRLVLKSLEDDRMTINSNSLSIYQQRIRKENLRRELEEMQNDLRNLCPFLNLCSLILSSSLNQIQRQSLREFQLTFVTFLTELHLSDFDSNRMLRYLPSWDDYFESFQTILQQPQQMFAQQWKNLLEFDTCLKDIQSFTENLRQQGLTKQCQICGNQLFTGLEETSPNSCQCQKKKKKDSQSKDLSIKGRGFFGTTNPNCVLPFQSIFIKDEVSKEEIKKILDDFRVSFDELDNYCESNQWLCEINRYCLQWTPNQMKQMSEGKQVFLIEEQLNLLRGWIEKTRTFELNYSTLNGIYSLQLNCRIISEDLSQKLSRIYHEFGKYLFRYASSNAQILIDQFQTALQIFSEEPNGIEGFAQYASHLAPHKNELSSYLQSIEYFTNLFEIIYNHFGHFREENENESIDKLLNDTWKLFQKKLSDAADFVAQQTLIIKERLQDTFEKFYEEAEILFYQSTTGKFVDPQQEPMEIVKILRKNCLEFLVLEKQLRQYAQWRLTLASNNSNSNVENEIDPQQMENVDLWSNQIELRKDLWK